MWVYIGILVLLAGVLGGYVLEHGNLLVLFQPAELLIIGGAAVGALMVANPVHVLKGIGAALPAAFRPMRHGKREYADLLKLLHDLFASARRHGVSRLESDIEQPHESALFAEFPAFLKDRKAVRFLSDTLRVFLMGGVSAYDIETLMERDAEAQAHEDAEPVHALQNLADALPGIGIVAAVLGIVITMGALGGPAGEVGRQVAAALVGTFLGILMCYGFVGPISVRLTKINDAEQQYYLCLRTAIIAYVRGYAPLLAVEYARRTVAPHLRPSFDELEEICRGTKAAAEAEPAAQAA